MAGERTHPILTFPNLDDAISFYEALGFRRTYRQVRPNPYAVVELEDIVVHLSAVEGFDPTTSLGSVVVVVPDADALYSAFAAGLRQVYGRLPSAGIPRILRPRRKQGTTAGFTVVDVGGNWLRIYRAGDSEDDGSDRKRGLSRVVEVAARQGDAHGDDALALEILERGLAQHTDAPAVERARAQFYRAELLTRLGRGDEAAAALRYSQVGLSEEDKAALLDDLRHAREVVDSER